MRVSLSRIISKGFIHLSKYIPETLFLESNLPSVTVMKPYEDKPLEHVDVPIALNLYVPGRPLYRRTGQGTYIPVRIPYIKDPSTSIEQIYSVINHKHQNIDDNIYGIERLRKKPHQNDIPEELISFIEKHIHTGFIDPRIYLLPLRLRKIKPYYFKRIEQNNYLLHWYIYWSISGNLLGTNFSLMESIPSSCRNPSKSCTIDLISDKSIAYPRYSISTINEGNEEPIYKRKINTLLNKLIKKPFNIEIKYDALLYRFIYAIDYYPTAYSIQNDSIARYIVRNKGISPHRIRGLLRSRVIRGIFIKKGYMPKILSIEEPDMRKIALLGYEIEDTTLLKIPIDNYLDSLIDLLYSAENPSSINNLGDLYRLWTINTIANDFIKLVIERDLIINAIVQCPTFGYLVGLAFSYNDLKTMNVGQTIHNILRGTNSEYTANALIEILLSYNNAYTRRNKLNHIMSQMYTWLLRGERSSIKCKIEENKDSLKNRVKDYLDKLVSDGSPSPSIAAIKQVALHSLNHYIIKTISRRTNLSEFYLTEVYRDVHYGSRSILVGENMSGGIGAIYGYIDKVTRDPAILLDDILSMGKCLIGGPEDLIYFTILRRYIETGKIDVEMIDRQELVKTVDALGVIYTPDELDEAEKLYNSILDSAFSLARLFDKHRKIGEISIKIFAEVMKARIELEMKLQRFSEPEELFIYILKNLSSFTWIRELLKILITRYISSKFEQYKFLMTEYHQTRIPNIVEQILEDISNILNNAVQKNTLSKILQDYGRPVEQLIIDIGRIGINALRRLFLQTCIRACPTCLITTTSCGRYQYPPAQELSLNRRILKIIATHLIKEYFRTEGRDKIDQHISGLLGALRIDGDKRFMIRAD